MNFFLAIAQHVGMPIKFNHKQKMSMRRRRKTNISPSSAKENEYPKSAEGPPFKSQPTGMPDRREPMTEALYMFPIMEEPFTGTGFWNGDEET